MNYLKSIADKVSASVLTSRRSPVASQHPSILSQAELKQIVAEALG